MNCLRVSLQARHSHLSVMHILKLGKVVIGSVRRFKRECQRSLVDLMARDSVETLGER